MIVERRLFFIFASSIKIICSYKSARTYFLHKRLLIEPSGIEIACQRLSFDDSHHLLIEPSGIEIRKSLDSEFAIYKLLIEPSGIEIDVLRICNVKPVVF